MNESCWLFVACAWRRLVRIDSVKLFIYMCPFWVDFCFVRIKVLDVVDLSVLCGRLGRGTTDKMGRVAEFICVRELVVASTIRINLLRNINLYV